jgi:hypothetical protein
LAIQVTGLTADLLNGATAAFPLSGTLVNEQNFRTCQPTALWAAASIPLDDIAEATLNGLNIVQTETVANGVIIDIGGGQYTFAVAVEATVTIDLVFNGEPVVAEPQVVLVPLAGTITISGCNAEVSFDLDIDINESLPKPIPGKGEIPLDIPTILPPGDTAHFLLTTDLESFDVMFTLDGSAVANGTKLISIADWNGDCIVNSTDVALYFNDWFLDQANGTLVADINGDLTTNSTDVSIFLNEWFLAQ